MAKSEQELAAERMGKGDKAKTKSAFYKLQREHAEESGDQATTDKIYAKLGKKSHNVDSDRGNKAILKGVAEGAALGGLGRFAEFGAAGAKAAAAGGLARTANLAKRGEGAIEGAVQKLRTPTPVKKALGSGVRKLESKAKKTLDNVGKKAISGNKSSQKALPAGKYTDFENELAKMQKKGKNMPKNPKTFNRNGTLRAEGRQKSTRNPVSKRKKKSD